MYQGAAPKTRMCRRADDETVVNTIMRQCFLDISTRLRLLLDSSTTTLEENLRRSPFSCFLFHSELKRNVHIFILYFQCDFPCKGHVKSVYSDDESGIAFLIKTES